MAHSVATANSPNNDPKKPGRPETAAAPAAAPAPAAAAAVATFLPARPPLVLATPLELPMPAVCTAEVVGAVPAATPAPAPARSLLLMLLASASMALSAPSAACDDAPRRRNSVSEIPTGARGELAGLPPALEGTLLSLESPDTTVASRMPVALLPCIPSSAPEASDILPVCDGEPGINGDGDMLESEYLALRDDDCSAPPMRGDGDSPPPRRVDGCMPVPLELLGSLGDGLRLRHKAAAPPAAAPEPRAPADESPPAPPPLVAPSDAALTRPPA